MVAGGPPVHNHSVPDARLSGWVDPSLLHPYNCRERRRTGSHGNRKPAGQTGCVVLPGPFGQIYDIFEGTEQIQELVISRAISGLRIE